MKNHFIYITVGVIASKKKLTGYIIGFLNEFSHYTITGKKLNKSIRYFHRKKGNRLIIV